MGVLHEVPPSRSPVASPRSPAHPGAPGALPAPCSRRRIPAGAGGVAAAAGFLARGGGGRFCVSSAVCRKNVPPRCGGGGWRGAGLTFAAARGMMRGCEHPRSGPPAGLPAAVPASCVRLFVGDRGSRAAPAGPNGSV